MRDRIVTLLNRALDRSVEFPPNHWFKSQSGGGVKMCMVDVRLFAYVKPLNQPLEVTYIDGNVGIRPFLNQRSANIGCHNRLVCSPQ